MKYFFYTVIMVFLTLAGAELLLRLFIDLPDPYADLRTKTFSTGSVIRLQNTPNEEITFVFNPNELFPKDEPRIIDIHINNYGFRHEDDIDLSKDELSIFAIGGSTTQGYDYPYINSWCKVLEDSLETHFNIPLNVYNGGTAGAALFDHLALLQNRVLHLNPDLVILFCGINDLNLLLGDDNKYRFNNIYESVAQISWFKLGLSRLTIYKLIMNVKHKLKRGIVEQHVHDEDQIDLPSHTTKMFMDHVNIAKETQTLPLATENPSPDFHYYQSMLKSFLGACMANDVPVVLMTQPTTWNTSDEALQKYHWMNKNETQRFDKAFMQTSMDKMNEDAAEIAGNLDVPHYRLDKNIDLNGEYFYDDCHFTPKGSVLTGKLLAGYLIENKLIPID